MIQGEPNMKSHTSNLDFQLLHGFTLIELLVVVAIIAVLIATLLPALQQARNTAQKLACQTRIRNIGMVHHFYIEDYGRYPYLRRHGGSTNQRPVWGLLIWPYMKSVEMYKCPSNPLTPADWVIIFGHKGLSSYGVNMRAIDCVETDSDLDGHKGSRRPEEISRPSEKIIVIEIFLSYNVIGWSDGTGWCYNPGFYWGYKIGANANHDPLARGEYHSGGANYSFADGHVEWISMDEMSKWVIEDDPYHPSPQNPWVVEK